MLLGALALNIIAQGIEIAAPEPFLLLLLDAAGGVRIGLEPGQMPFGWLLAARVSERRFGPNLRLRRLPGVLQALHIAVEGGLTTISSIAGSRNARVGKRRGGAGDRSAQLQQRGNTFGERNVVTRRDPRRGRGRIPPHVADRNLVSFPSARTRRDRML